MGWGAGVHECRGTVVGGKYDGDETRGLHLVKLIANNDLHDFRWDIVHKLL